MLSTTMRQPDSLLAPAKLVKTRRTAAEPQQFPPLEMVNRPTVPTEQAAHYLLRRPQTLRGWASAETFPDGLRPVRINGRLGWPVAGIKAALGVEQ
jgi:hypothetical protein